MVKHLEEILKKSLHELLKESLEEFVPESLKVIIKEFSRCIFKEIHERKPAENFNGIYVETTGKFSKRTASNF